MIELKGATVNFLSLDEAKTSALGCTACGLCQGRKNVVFAKGNDQAKLMLIGEGPGQMEDETGLPFVGRAGQLLDRILASVNISLQDIYICNIVKCRPPQNRVPAGDEMEACRRFLMRS